MTGYCPKCGGLISIRNPTGKCDHLYYPENRDSGIKDFKTCGICGGILVYIRGRYPNHDNRLVCPCCLQERIEQINDISSINYGKANEVSADLKRTGG